MFSTQIANMTGNLTTAERTIADFLIDKYTNNANMKMMSSEQIARSTHVGQSTVIRFSQKLGYPSFKNMMQDLINESFFYSGNTKAHKNESVETSISNLKYQYEQSINEVIQNLDINELEKACVLLEDADTVICYGMKSSAAMASIMYFRLLEMGLKTMMSQDITFFRNIIYNCKKNDVLLVVSVSGESEDALSVVRYAHKRGLKIIAITISKENSIGQLSDVVLSCSEYNVYKNKYNLVNRCSELMLIDLITIRFWYRNEEKLLKRVEEFDSLLYEDDSDTIPSSRF